MPARPATALAQERRLQAGVKIDWRINEVVKTVNLSMEKRVRLATAILEERIVRNISRPVTKGTGPRGGRVVTDRSKSGEFPKADTPRLNRSIIRHVEGSGEVWNGHIGVTLDYGLILELRMDRSFLVRTLREERSKLTSLLTRPIT